MTDGVGVVAVLVVSGERNFQRFALAVLRQAGHAAFATGGAAPEVAVQVRLRAPHVVLLDRDHGEAARVRRVLGRTAVVEVAADPGPGPAGAIGKWDGGGRLVAAVEEAVAAARRRSLLHVVQP